MIVLDASAAMSILAPSQRTDRARKFVAEETRPLLVPGIFHLEVRQGLLRLERQGRLRPEDVTAHARDIGSMIAQTAPPPDAASLERLLALSRDLGVSIYDACYLDLAISGRHPIATRDGGIVTAAQRSSVEVIDFRAPSPTPET